MDNRNQINWGIIGCGEVTEVKSGPAYKKTPGFKLAAVMRRNAELAEDYAKRHQIDKHYACADALINDSDIDAVYIATPPDSHKQYGLQVAAAGKICCIEKPLAPSYADCQAIVSAFAAAKLPLFVAYYRRTLPRFNQVKTLLDDGEIGQVRHVNWHLSKAASELDRSGGYNWRTDKQVAPGGYFDDLASHGLDLFAYLLGEYIQVKGIARNQQQFYSAYDAISACWSHASGATGSGSWNFGSAAREDKVTLYGSAGEIQFSVFDEGPVVLLKGGERREFWIEHPENIQLHHVQSMQQALVGGLPHPSTGESAAHTGWVMDQILGIE